MAAIASAVVWNSAAAAAAAGVLLLLGRTGALQRRPGLRHCALEYSRWPSSVLRRWSACPFSTRKSTF